LGGTIGRAPVRESGDPRPLRIGGESEIRTHGGVTPTAVFKTAALNHSAISPKLEIAMPFAEGFGKSVPLRTAIVA
jgi:hypothetical protein